jgi:hypothetical protein
MYENERREFAEYRQISVLLGAKGGPFSSAVACRFLRSKTTIRTLKEEGAPPKKLKGRKI